MKSERGFTLVEVVIATMLMGVIALVFFQAAAFGYKNTLYSKKFTHDSFLVQQDLENKITSIKDKDLDPSKGTIESRNIFGKNVEGYLIERDIREDDTSSPHGKYTAFVPKINIVYPTPVVKSVSLKLKDSDLNSISLVTVNPVKNEVTTNLSFTFIGSDGGISDPDDVFLMNVYKWYLSPETPYKINENYKEFINLNSYNFLMLKEYNKARPEKTYDKDLSIVPNIKENYDSFSFNELKTGKNNQVNFTNKEIVEFFQGRYIFYSVTPYSTLGKIGKEVFSDPIYIEPVAEETSSKILD